MDRWYSRMLSVLILFECSTCPQEDGESYHIWAIKTVVGKRSVEVRHHDCAEAQRILSGSPIDTRKHMERCLADRPLYR